VSTKSKVKKKPPSSTVLVVDSDKNYNKTLTTLLKKNGYKTLSAYDGEKAYDKFKSKPPDIVITEYDLPVLTGEELIKNIKRDDPGFPVLLHPEDSSESVFMNCLIYPQTFIIKKPASPSALMESIDYLITLVPVDTKYDEKRKFRRVEVNLPVTIHNFGEGKVTNISAGGLFVETNHDFKLGANIRMTLFISDAEFDGEVVCQSTSKGVGVKFRNTADTSRKILYSFIYNHLKNAHAETSLSSNN